MKQDTLTQLNAANAAGRLLNLRNVMAATDFPPVGVDVNNHIHTTFSFSPYSPTAAAYMARMSGLCTAGIMDHDTIMGAREFLQACDILGIGGTCGLECRVSFDGTRLAGRRINNPDQDGVGYIMLHAVPHEKIETVDAFFAPLREKRNRRNEKMITKLNALHNRAELMIDFARDVYPISQAAQGGTVTERHISSALATKLEAAAGRGDALIAYIQGAFNTAVDDKYSRMFKEADNPYFHYDLIGWIKAELIPRFYVDADEECAGVREVLALSEEVGALSAYAYLGDVGDSVTGDKRPQKFEDSYLDELFEEIKTLGFRAVTYMPARNTRGQVERVREKINAAGFFEISGEDINQPRQPFICMAMRDPAFDALRESAWAMIAHERQANGLFSEAAALEWPSLAERTAAFAQMGRHYARL